jgi:probable O-glycosylation ligase (exosortase A-associated)
MRDLALVATIFGCLPLILRYPFVGILIWAWISIAVPHQEVWGFSQSIPLNLIVALATIGAWFFSSERRLPPPQFLYWAMIVFLMWVTFTSFFAFKPEWSWQYWDRCWKIIFLGFFAAGMATNKVRLHALMWVVVISLFYYGVKGGIFTLVTGGHYHVFGPANSYIGDNNCLALALLMGLPLANYLRMQTREKWLSLGILFAMGLTLVSILGSYSRGAIIGLGTILVAGLLRTRHRVLYLTIAVVVGAVAFNFMPESFHERVQTISNAGEDESFMARVSAWEVAYYCARDHFPMGVGFYTPQLAEIFNHYLPDAGRHAAHSIYFQVLGEHGFMGLAIYLALIAGAFTVSSRIRKLTRDNAELRWVFDMASMIQISLLAFCVGGAALSLAYYDVFFLNVALLLPLQQIARGAVAKSKVPQSVAIRPIEGMPALA